MNDFLDLMKKCRSYRRFDNSVQLDKLKLLEWVDITRYAPSGVNRQPLKYIAVADKERNLMVFDTLTWAAMLKDWAGPEPEEQPTGYVIILHDKTISQNYFCDHGIAAHSMLLAATNDGFGGCIVAAVNRPELAKSLFIPDNYEILLVVAFGKPSEQVVLESMDEGEFKYYRDANNVHHVPKRDLDEIVVEFSDNSIV